ncbi:MAG: nitrilase family protein [Saprospiraceae bacterium]|nr:nitrilase family protein [Saprospiraceae bacterium]
MKLTIVQNSLLWEQASENRARFAEILAPLAGRTDLVVLPEMFTTGFSMNAGQLAEPMDGPTVAWMQEQASRLDAALAGSFICRENDRYYNRLVFMRPGGQFDFYDKKHLFSLAEEHIFFSAGNKQLVVEWRGWRIRPLVCYDLRFPVWSATQGFSAAEKAAAESREQAMMRDETSLLLYVANWPARRSHHWRSLLTARAVENQAFVAGVNIVGKDGNGLEYTGHSSIIDYSGQPIAEISGAEGVFTAELSLEDMRQYRRQLPFLPDGDLFQLR